MQQEVEFEWDKLKAKNTQKISFLLNKWKGDQANVCDQWRDILISDEKLKEQFEEPTIAPINDDNIQLSQDEIDILVKPPKFTTYDKVDVTKGKASREITDMQHTSTNC